MANLYHHQSQNITKTWFLMALFIAIVVGLGYAFGQVYQNNTIVIVALVFSVVMNITAFWFSDRIALSSAGALPADESEFRELHRLVENLAITGGLPKPRVYIINDPAPNAFATGRNPEHSAVAVTTGLLSVLDRRELEGVIAHELAHVGNRDVLVMTVAVVLAGFVAFVADMASRMMFFSDSDDNRGGILGFVVVIAATLLAQLGAFLIQMAISRKREYLADATGALLTRYPEGLASALEKISSYQGTMHSASAATAHLYIANPFGAHNIRSKISNMFSTHPPAEERIARLREMAM